MVTRCVRPWGRIDLLQMCPPFIAFQAGRREGSPESHYYIAGKQKAHGDSMRGRLSLRSRLQIARACWKDASANERTSETKSTRIDQRSACGPGSPLPKARSRRVCVEQSTERRRQRNSLRDGIKKRTQHPCCFSDQICKKSNVHKCSDRGAHRPRGTTTFHNRRLSSPERK